MFGNRLDRWVGLVAILLICLTGCAFQGQDQGNSTRVTWTPVVHPTDRPYQVETETFSYFGETPVLVIFGSQDPMDDTPLTILNLSSDETYDVSSIPPAPVSVWSRPIVAGSKDVYFQIADMLYILSPGGESRSIELPYDSENPAFCNWSWKGWLVCLNNTLSVGFLVDQDLNVVEMGLPAEGWMDSEAYSEPYRVGENAIRILLSIPSVSRAQATVYYRDLDLETLTVESKEFRIEKDLYEAFTGNSSGNEMYVMHITRNEGEIEIIGISDSGEQAYLTSRVTYTQPNLNTRTHSRWWTSAYDGSELYNINFDFEIIPEVEKTIKGDYLITGWLFDPENEINVPPTVYDLDAGEIVLIASGSYLANEIINFILPYGGNWIAGDTLGIHYYRTSGGLMVDIAFPEAIVAAMGQDSLYTISQPMEP